MGEVCIFELGLWEYGVYSDEYMESRTDVHICRLFVVGFVDGENNLDLNLNEKNKIQIFVWEVGSLFEE